MRLYFSFLLLLISMAAVSAPKLTENAKIKLLTCGYGFEAYSMYGHTALRVIDTATNVDVIFNYGMFSMAEDNFIYKFSKGETDYQLGLESYRSFIRGYKRAKRWVYALDLNLQQEQKQAIFDALEENYKPENRVYRYSFFFDNCATRIRDLMENTLGDSLQWNSMPEYVPVPEKIQKSGVVADYMTGKKKHTFREIIHIYQSSVPWLNFAIDIPIAASADREMEFRETMFLPDFLMNGFQNATVLQSGQKIPLGVNPELIIYPEQKPPVLAFYETPAFVMWSLFFAFFVFSVLGMLRTKRYLWIDSILFFISGLIGLFLLFTCFISEHPVMTPNYNLWWAFPLNILFAALIYINKLRPLIFKFTAGLYLLFILAWAFLPQDINLLFVGIAGSIAVRNILYQLR